MSGTFAGIDPNLVGGRARIVSVHASAVIGHHAFQGRTNDCGPYCAAMVINASAPFGVTAEKLAQEMTRPSWHGIVPVIRRIPGSATFPWGIVDVLASYGLRSRWRLRASYADLVTAIDAGQMPLVVIGGRRPWWGHWVIVLGWDVVDGWALGDPGSAASALHWYPEVDFDAAWNAWGRQLVAVDVPQVHDPSSQDS